MSKGSGSKKARRAETTAKMAEIERAWRTSAPADELAKFDAQVKAAKARGPIPPPPDMAPGTRPNPPRPGHEPKPPKVEQRSRRRE